MRRLFPRRPERKPLLAVNPPLFLSRILTLPAGQAAAVAGAAVLSAAAAPLTTSARGADAAPERPTSPPVTAVAAPAGPVMRQILFRHPTPGFDVNSEYGLRRLRGEAYARAHRGVDIAAPSGTTVYAAAEGRVLRTGYEPGGYGLFVELAHPNGMTSLYAHLSRIDVARGETVAGQRRIGLVGSTGRSTGPHLHFEVRRDARPVNPLRVLGQSFSVTARA